MPTKMLSFPEMRPIVGVGRSATYQQVGSGLMVKPVKCGVRAVRFPADEVDQIMTARRAGSTDAEIRALVSRLHAVRAELANAIFAKGKVA